MTWLPLDSPSLPIKQLRHVSFSMPPKFFSDIAASTHSPPNLPPYQLLARHNLAPPASLFLPCCRDFLILRSFGDPLLEGFSSSHCNVGWFVSCIHTLSLSSALANGRFPLTLLVSFAWFGWVDCIPWLSGCSTCPSFLASGGSCSSVLCFSAIEASASIVFSAVRQSVDCFGLVKVSTANLSTYA